MTWNINRFDGEWNWYDKKMDLIEEKREEIAKETIRIISQYISNENDVAILQEFPFFKMPFNREVEYDKWKQFFKLSGLKVIGPYGTGNNRTVAVVPRNDWEKITPSFFEDSKDYLNKIVVIKKNSAIFVGVHIPDLRRQETESDKKAVRDLWLRLIEFCKKYNPDAICGDFNTDSELDEEGNDVPQFSLMEELKKIGYIEAQGEATRNKPGDNPTYRNVSHVDYILIKKDIKTNTYIKDPISLSDHIPVIAEIEI